MRAIAAMVAAVCSAVTAEAQNIPVRQVGPADAVATAKVDRFSLVRPLSNGRVIITLRRSVGILSADLKTYTSIVDSMALARATGATNQIAIIAGRGDTTYVADQAGGGLITVDANGATGRMIAAPKASDMSTIAFTNTGTFRTYMDPRGRLLYRSARPAGDLPQPGAPPPPITMVPADSFPLVRADFESRGVDTLGMVRIPNPRRSTTELKEDAIISRTIIYVGPIIDAWTMLTDGTVAIVRGADYHIDWIHPDGSRSSSAKMPFDWRRITDDEKTRIVDSLKKGFDAANASDDSTRRASSRPSNSRRTQEAAPASTIPDYFPPLREGSATPDLEGNIWILPTTSATAQGGGPLYDVINRKGEIFERVQFPAGCALAGFATGSVVYMICASTGLERRRILK